MLLQLLSAFGFFAFVLCIVVIVKLNSQYHYLCNQLDEMQKKINEINDIRFKEIGRKIDDIK